MVYHWCVKLLYILLNIYFTLEKNVSNFKNIIENRFIHYITILIIEENDNSKAKLYVGFICIVQATH